MEAQRGETIIRQAVWDSAGACISVQEKSSCSVAVLATTQAARSAGLRILVDGPHDADADVNACFLIIGRTGCITISPCPLATSRIRAVRKTTLLATVPNEPACLSSIFRVFADADVPVLAIQTRLLAPWSASRFHVHQVLVTFMSMDSGRSTLLMHLGERTVLLRVFGTYFSMTVAPSNDAAHGSESTAFTNGTGAFVPSNDGAAVVDAWPRS